MNLYVIYGNEAFDNNDNCVIEQEIISHETLFTNERFKEICIRAKEDLRLKNKSINLESLIDMLILNYGFKALDIKVSYSL